MSNQNNQNQPDNNSEDDSQLENCPTFVEHIDHIRDTFCKARVDLSRLQDYDLDDIDALGGFVGHESMKFCDQFCSNEVDLAYYTSGIMNSVSTIMAVHRSSASENNLLANLVIMLSQYCYETGVRDAHERRLSNSCQDAIAKWVNGKDKYLDRMRALYDDIR